MAGLLRVVGMAGVAVAKGLCLMRPRLNCLRFPADVVLFQYAERAFRRLNKRRGVVNVSG